MSLAGQSPGTDSSVDAERGSALHGMPEGALSASERMIEARRRVRLLLLVTLAILCLDQATKMAVAGFDLLGFEHEGMTLGQRIPLLGDVVRLTYVLNRGMAFGIDLGIPWLLGLFSIGAAIFIYVLLRRAAERGEQIGLFHTALALILGGAVGNLIDRVFYGLTYGYGGLFEGKVVDFIDVDIPDITLFGTFHDRFYIFNVADSAVSVGIVLLIIAYPAYQRYLEERREQTDDPSETSATNEGSSLPA